MSSAQANERLQIPDSLRQQLDDFRRRVWSIKLVEAAAAAATGVVVAFLVLFALDRFWNTPGAPRLALFALAGVACLAVPYALYRWVWRHRHAEQLARLLARKHPRIGDQLLGVLELAHDRSEQARSRRLVEAAIGQVAADAQKRDFRDAVPTPRHKLWLGALALPAAAAVALFLVCPAAASNTLARLLAPWRATPRYTFAMLEPVPGRLVVAHGEPYRFAVKLAEGTAWHPVRAEVRVNGRAPVAATLADGMYEFGLPPEVAPARLEVAVGDAAEVVVVEPMLRPELTAFAASVTLPEYLGRPGVVEKDARGGAVTLVKGSRARFTATAGRELASAWVDGVATPPDGAKIASPVLGVDGPRDVQFRWVDRHGLAGKDPFTLKVAGRDDEAPTLLIEDLPRQKVVLDSELLNFKVRAQDDFGVRRVGLEWHGIDRKAGSSLADGDKVIAAGGPTKETLEINGAFSAKSFGIEPQAIALRVFVDDYLPGRPRVVSAPYILFILTPEQHAIWLTEQLSKWHRQSLEVRDREMQLHEANKQLRALAAEDLDKPENRKKLEAQAAGEQANGRRLSGLVVSGEDLVKQAMRNPEFGVGHIERWAEMLQILKDISGNRMPSVAGLLKDAAQAPKGRPGAPANASNPPTEAGQADTKRLKDEGLAQQPQQPPAPARSNNAPVVGNQREGGFGKPTEPPPPGAPKPPTAVPTLADRESSQQLAPKKEEPPLPGSKPKSPRLTLPVTTLAGGRSPKPGDPPPPADEEAKVDAAIEQQRDLLAEFDKVADELNKVLANLEGSTLVKRLKAAARAQGTVATRIGEQVNVAFGATPPRPAAANPNVMFQAGRVPVAQRPPGEARPEAPAGPAAAVFDGLAKDEAKGSHNVSLIMDDMSAYFERRQMARFKAVLDEMRQTDVIGSLRQLGDDLRHEQGLSIAQAEYWSDSLDRWADDLVDPTMCGACPGSKSKSSLPPSVVLEVLQCLEAEINLREETRGAEQARPELAADEHLKAANALAKTQREIRERICKVTDRIKGLPDAEAEFGKEIGLLEEVAEVMFDATVVLTRPDTGAAAIATETDAIELLLQSKRINPKAGGGGGSSPGGGGRGTTDTAALALIGRGTNKDEVREDRGVQQSTGDTGPALPEEFRAGLDQYFNKLDRGPAGK